MPEEESESITQLVEKSNEAQSVSVDGQSVRRHSLKDLIELDRYRKAEQAKRKGLGIRVVKLVPPGSV